MLVLKEIMQVKDSFLFEVDAAETVSEDSKGRGNGQGGARRCMGMIEGCMDASKFSPGDSVCFTFSSRVDCMGGAIDSEVKGSPYQVGAGIILYTSSVCVVCRKQRPSKRIGRGVERSEFIEKEKGKSAWGKWDRVRRGSLCV